MCVCVCLGTCGLLYTYAYVQYSTYSLVGGVPTYILYILLRAQGPRDFYILYIHTKG